MVTEAKSADVEILDLNTELENYLLGGAVVGLGMGLYFRFFIQMAHFHHPLEPWCWGSGGLCLILRLLVDNHYEVDYAQRLVFYHFKLAFYKRLRPVACFDEIMAIGVQGHYTHSDLAISKWSYFPVLVTRRGKMMALANTSGFAEAGARAQALAARFGTTTLEAQEERILRWRKGKAAYVTLEDLSGWKVFLTVLATLILIGGFMGRRVFNWF